MLENMCQKIILDVRNYFYRVSLKNKSQMKTENLLFYKCLGGIR